ncbi:MAG: hypothetical protein IT429_00865 [Gemmataceae bacterium]|nr:hypothetical protein [Gemmataceae bacterium]
MTMIEKIGQRLYLVGLPFAAKDRAKAIGAHWDGDRRQWWVGAAKTAAAEALAAELNAAPVSATESGPETVGEGSRVYARVEYKGRKYYVVAESPEKGRCRLTTLQGTPAFWADMVACTLIRTYEGRPERGAFGRPTGRTAYTTLGSLRAFVGRETRARDAGATVCAECGLSGELVADLEDGLLKHRRCCDIEP